MRIFSWSLLVLCSIILWVSQVFFWLISAILLINSLINLCWWGVWCVISMTCILSLIFLISWRFPSLILRLGCTATIHLSWIRFICIIRIFWIVLNKFDAVVLELLILVCSIIWRIITSRPICSDNVFCLIDCCSIISWLSRISWIITKPARWLLIRLCFQNENCA